MYLKSDPQTFSVVCIFLSRLGKNRNSKHVWFLKKNLCVLFNKQYLFDAVDIT